MLTPRETSACHCAGISSLRRHEITSQRLELEPFRRNEIPRQLYRAESGNNIHMLGYGGGIEGRVGRWRAASAIQQHVAPSEIINTLVHITNIGKNNYICKHEPD